MKTVKSGEKKTECLVNLGPKEQHGGEFLGGSFCLIYWRILAHTHNEPQEKLVLFSLGTKKGTTCQTRKVLDNDPGWIL